MWLQLGMRPDTSVKCSRGGWTDSGSLESDISQSIGSDLAGVGC